MQCFSCGGGWSPPIGTWEHSSVNIQLTDPISPLILSDIQILHSEYFEYFAFYCLDQPDIHHHLPVTFSSFFPIPPSLPPPTPHLFQLASFTVCCLRQNKNLGKFVRRMHFCKQMKPARKSFENSCHWEKNKSNQAETSSTLTPNIQFKKVACYGDFGSSSSTSESDFKSITVAHLMNKTATHGASIPGRLLLKSHYG